MAKLTAVLMTLLFSSCGYAQDNIALKIYFHCQTKLIETFKGIYSDEFEYEGKRVIVAPLGAGIREKPLRQFPPPDIVPQN